MTSSLIPEIRTFVRVVELGSFAAAAEEAGLTPSGISRTISRIEDRLGTVLFHRSTRKLTLTSEGSVFLRFARDFIDLEAATEAELSKVLDAPRGHLTVNCGTAFARHVLSPILPKFIDTYPDITIDVSVSDRRIDPVSAQVDVTIRVGELQDSDLTNIRLGTVRRIIAASPSYLKRNGIPKSPKELDQHSCLLLTGFSRQAIWPMIEDGKKKDVKVSGPVSSDNADVLLHMAIEGAGIIRLGDFLGAEALRSGQLKELLSGQYYDDPKPLTALVLPNRNHVPRVRVFLDFLKGELHSQRSLKEE